MAGDVTFSHSDEVGQHFLVISSEALVAGIKYGTNTSIALEEVDAMRSFNDRGEYAECIHKMHERILEQHIRLVTGIE
jgi:GDP-D-mannose dehydratase